MINRVVLCGRLTRDPDLRFVGDGKPVVSFTIAVNRTFKNQNGETEADFINCVAWRNAENIAKFLKKGSMTGVDGRLQTRSYDDQSGRRVFVTEVNVESVQFLDPNGSGQADSRQQGGAGRNQSSGQQGNSFPDDPFANEGKPIDISDEDLPF
ncbi:single-stranded DNA-binding protein [Bacillus licheniformis]